jgi:hypothetical protein
MFSFLRDRFLPWFFITLLVLIPLYPKLPILDVSYTWTYIRVEDFLALVAYVVLGVLLIARKVQIKSFLFWPIVIFWFIGLLSTIIALPRLENGDGYVTYKPILVVLHYLRRIEYLGMFFVGFVALQNMTQFKRVLVVLAVTLASVSVYGLGQQYASFPAFLTMNEEFAKGNPLPLQPGGRVSSTFGGHYDLAGYLVLVMPIICALLFYPFGKWVKASLAVTLMMGFYVMLLTSSRISFGALLVSFAILLFSFIPHKRNVLAIFLVLLVVVGVFGRENILDRFAKTIRVKQVNYNPSVSRVLEEPTKNKDWGGLPESDTALLIPFAPVEATSSAYKVFKYHKSEYEKIKEENPDSDITTIEIPQVLTNEEMQTTKNEIIEEYRLVEGDFQRRWALVFDISLTTRVQGGWPIAWRAFLTNPITGKGYSTVTAAVDSSYMRALGEVGLVGFISFFAIIGIFLMRSFSYLKTQVKSLPALYITGLCCGIVGLLINAILIDIFEASKVAFLLWMLIGVGVALIVKKDLV